MLRHQLKKAFHKLFSKLQPNLERGIDFVKVKDSDLNTLLNHHQWMKLASPRTENVNLSIVREFYAALSKANFAKNDIVFVRMVGVTFSAKEINAYYGIEDVPEITYIQKWELTDEAKLFQKGLEAKKILGPDAVWDPTHNIFNFVGVKKNDRIIKHLINANILPSTHVNDFSPEEACLTLAFISKEPIDVGKKIFDKAFTFATSKTKTRIPFPDLITTLCRKFEVPELDDDLLVEASTVHIGPRLPKVVSAPTQVPSTQESVPAPPPPHTNDYRFLYMNARVDTMEQNMLNMRNDFSFMMNDIRGWIRGMNDYHSFLHRSKDPSPCYTCQSEPYTLSTWIPPPPYPSHAQSSGQGGPSTIFTGTEAADEE